MTLTRAQLTEAIYDGTNHEPEDTDWFTISAVRLNEDGATIYRDQHLTVGDVVPQIAFGPFDTLAEAVAHYARELRDGIIYEALTDNGMIAYVSFVPFAFLTDEFLASVPNIEIGF
jgi:hypothetical protein